MNKDTCIAPTSHMPNTNRADRISGVKFNFVHFFYQFLHSDPLCFETDYLRSTTFYNVSFVCSTHLSFKSLRYIFFFLHFFSYFSAGTTAGCAVLAANVFLTMSPILCPVFQELFNERYFFQRNYHL